MPKFTPGPWRHTDLTIYALEYSHCHVGTEIMQNRFDCRIQGPKSTPLEEKEANARLIAAAPELYRIIRDIILGNINTRLQAENEAYKLYKEIDGD